MTNDSKALRERVQAMLDRWKVEGLPARQSLGKEANALRAWRSEQGIESLWPRAPLMTTATLDDGFGFGLEVIELFAAALGLRVHPLGLRQSPEAIIASCRDHPPALLGLTVLQFDTEEALAEVARGIPAETKLIVGGAIFAADPELALRTGVHFVARDAAAFLRYLLEFQA